jgi:hypothetical protein
MRAFKSRSSRLAGLVVLAMAAGAFLVWALPGMAGLSLFNEDQVSGTAHDWVARNSNDGPQCTSGGWQEVGDTRVTFHTDSFHQRALIDFEAAWGRSGEGTDPRGNMRALIDGDIVFIGNGDTFVHASAPGIGKISTHGFKWISEELHPGSHSAWIEFQEANVGTAQVCVGERSIIVSTP